MSIKAVLYTIRIQVDELKATREELELTREEMEKSSEALVGQREVMRNQYHQIQKQTFESSFFNLLSYFSQKIELLTPKNATSKFSDINHAVVNKVINSSDSFETSMQRYHAHTQPIEDYFRIVIALLELVDKRESSDRIFYIDIIESQLTLEQLRVWFSYGLMTEYGLYKLRPLIERYALLRSLPEANDTYNITPEHVLSVDLYNTSAFEPGCCAAYIQPDNTASLRTFQ